VQRKKHEEHTKGGGKKKRGKGGGKVRRLGRVGTAHSLCGGGENVQTRAPLRKAKVPHYLEAWVVCVESGDHPTQPQGGEEKTNDEPERKRLWVSGWPNEKERRRF